MRAFPGFNYDIKTSLDILPYSTPFNNQSIINVPTIITPISTYLPSPLAPLCEGKQHCHSSNHSNNNGSSNNSGRSNKNRTTTSLRQTIISPVRNMFIRLRTPTHTLYYKASASVLITTSKIFSAMLCLASSFSEARLLQFPLLLDGAIRPNAPQRRPVAFCIISYSMPYTITRPFPGCCHSSSWSRWRL